MTPPIEVPTVGVEEEYQLVDPETGALVSCCQEVMKHVNVDLPATVQHELHLNQIEMASDVCYSLSEVRSTLQRTRAALVHAAEQVGVGLAAAGTNPLSVPHEDDITPKDRYLQMSQRYQHLARELFIFGCHVHVGIPNHELGLLVMNQCRRWLPMLQALTANSPFWNQEDTGYASYRREMWAQWPLAGPPPHFSTIQDYEACIEQLVRCGAIKDESFIYWDVRLPTKVPTIEFRGADVLTSLEDTVGYVGVIRGLVMRAISEIQAGHLLPSLHDNVLRYAMWQAARFGTSEELVDPLTCKRLTAASYGQHLLEYLKPVVESESDWDCIHRFVTQTVIRGPGANHQRQVFDESSGSLSSVVEAIIVDTAAAS